jgi:glycosyltransferase involved in cell wall biosynthesis
MSNPPALVLVTTSFPTRGDGSEAAGSFVSDLAEELARYVPTRVVAPGPHSTHETRADGVDVFRFAVPAKPLSTLVPWNPADLLAIRRVLISGQAATRQAVRFGPTAHILALWALPSGHWARRTGVPYSVWTLGSDIWSLGRIPVVRSYLRRALRDARTCYSDGLKLLEDTRRIGGREVEFLPSTRRIERVRTAPLKTGPPYRLLFLGRWHSNKGVDLLIDALKLLNNSDWQRIDAVEICGGGPLEAVVRTGVESLRAAGRPVELRGFLSKPAAEDAILRADYLLIPSRIDSIPVVFSDAMKLRCPVLVSPVGDLPGLVNAEPACGMSADDVSAASFADLVSRALHQSVDVFSAGLWACAQRFSLEASAKRILCDAFARRP